MRKRVSMNVLPPLLSLLVPLLFAQGCARAPLSFAPTPKDKLPSLGVDKSTVTVSGISSGAFMAVQMGVAYSDQIHGVSSVAGGIYSCALGQASKATGLCMKTPDKIDVPSYVNLVRESAQKNLISDPKHIAHQKIFILDGTEDKVVDPAAGKKLVEFYKAFKAEPKTNFTLKSGHGFPSNQGANKSCSANQLPWTNKCDYEGAEKIFETMYGAMKPATKKSSKDLDGELLKFDQTEFTTSESMMLSYGHVYIPKACKAPGSDCRLHVALHGCLQAPNLVGNAFVEDANYNVWADENKIVVLYPATTASLKNPNGCWDWYGYTNGDYAIQSAPQMVAIMKMIQHLEAKK